MKIDFKPKELAQVRTSLWKLLTVESANLVLSAVRVHGVYGWGEAFSTIFYKVWLKEIERQAPLTYLASISGLPRYLSNLTRAFVSAVVWIPWSELQKSKHHHTITDALTHVAKNWFNFFRELTLGSVGLLGRTAMNAATLLDQVQLLLLDENNDDNDPSPLLPHPPPSSNQVVTHMKPQSKYAHQPASIREGLHQACYTVFRELQGVKKQIILVPLAKYKQEGVPGYVKGMVKAVPIALLKPMIGTTEGLGRLIFGLRNSIDQREKQDMDNKYG
jgi:autophagy-related protein 2